MTKEKYKLLEFKIADNFLFGHNNLIDLPMEIQRAIFGLFRISEIDGYPIMKEKL